MRIKLLDIILIFIVLTLSSCHDDVDVNSSVSPSDKRTIIGYMIMENNLADPITKDIEEMLVAAPSLKNGERVVLYVDDLKRPRIYLIDNKTRATKLNDVLPVYTYEKDQNSASEIVMKDVFKYIVSHYPSASYGLILSSHGNAWLPSKNDDDNTIDVYESRNRRAFGVDNGLNIRVNKGNELNISGLSRAVHTLPYLDFIFFDACYMQNIETAYEFRDCCNYILGSAAEVPADGAPYDLILQDFFTELFEPSVIVDKYADSYQGWFGDNGVVYSAINCKYLNILNQEVKSIFLKYGESSIISAGKKSTNYMDYFYKNWSYQASMFDIQDLIHNTVDDNDYNRFLETIRLVVPKSKVAKEVYSALYTTDDTKLYYNVKTNPNFCCGVSMSLIPESTASNFVLDTYHGLEWKYKDI